MRRMAMMGLLVWAAASVGFGQVAGTAPVSGEGGAGGGVATQPVNKVTVQVPVRRVVLFSSGVGFFQHEGVVEGTAATELRFKTEQINDILKSLVLSDRDGGTIRTVTYPSQDPLAKTLKSFQIDISNNPPMAELLNQIRGTAVKVEYASVNGLEKLEGKILGVELKEKPVGKDGERVMKTWVLNLIMGTKIRSLALEGIESLEMEDPTLQRELNEALGALGQARDKDKKPVIVNFEGEGKRHVAVGYVVETPIWKTSYRLMLPEISSKDNAKLQGWAIVENQTDNDWNEVSLDLVGGRPLGFIENLYQPLYIPRPVVQPRVFASVRPQTYDEGMEGRKLADMKQEERSADRADADMGKKAPAPPTMNLSEVTKSGTTAGGSAGQGGLFSGPGESDGPANYGLGVASIASAVKIGEMFHYAVEKVSLPRQRSSMIPIVTEAVEFDRLSIYNAGVLARNPLLGVRLKNKTTKYLLAGPLTVMDSTKTKVGDAEREGLVYAGDAKIDDVPPGQERLLSYAVDQETLVDSTKANSSDELVTGSIVKGVLVLKFRSEMTQDYVVENKRDRDRTVLIEHPVNSNYELKEPERALEKTDTLYRFALPVGAKKMATLHVRQEWIRGEQVAILPMDLGAVDFYFNSGAIPKKVKDVLLAVAEKKRAAVELERQLQLKNQERTRAFDEERNMRENIKVLPAGSKPQQDQIAELTAKDAEIKTINKDIKELQGQIEKAKADLEKFIVETTVE